jgi:hypothetical protein
VVEAEQSSLPELMATEPPAPTVSEPAVLTLSEPDTAQEIKSQPEQGRRHGRTSGGSRARHGLLNVQVAANSDVHGTSAGHGAGRGLRRKQGQTEQHNEAASYHNSRRAGADVEAASDLVVATVHLAARALQVQSGASADRDVRSRGGRAAAVHLAVGHDDSVAGADVQLAVESNADRALHCEQRRHQGIRTS